MGLAKLSLLMCVTPKPASERFTCSGSSKNASSSDSRVAAPRARRFASISISQVGCSRRSSSRACAAAGDVVADVLPTVAGSGPNEVRLRSHPRATTIKTSPMRTPNCSKHSLPGDLQVATPAIVVSARRGRACRSCGVRPRSRAPGRRGRAALSRRRRRARWRSSRRLPDRRGRPRRARSRDRRVAG